MKSPEFAQRSAFLLILFDIDATLISTSGIGIKAMEDAAREAFGAVDLSDVEYAGRLDPLIVADIFRRAGAERSLEAVASFRAAYGEGLRRWLGKPGIVAAALPGVMDLVAALREREGVTMGLLTGNYRETGSIKLRACGIEPDEFPLAVWGDESANDPPDRADLPPIAMTRYRAMRGNEIPPRRVTIIGDTPHDVRCARVHGCRSLGVATGRYTVAQLQAAGADLAVGDLSVRHRVMDWLLSPSGC